MPEVARHGIETPKYGFVDALRGYAILLVMGCHALLSYSGLVWPEKRLASLGWHGVQLFFVASSLTLLLSWTNRAGREARPVAAFFIRRVFRIAPMYYAAFLAYLIVVPPGAAFSLVHALATLGFVNGWSPGLLSMVEGSWAAVPGSWSVADEFGFYLFFPALAGLITTLPRAALALLLSLVAAFLLNRFAFQLWVGPYGWKATDQFLYYWLPNQLPVFMVGFCTFHALARLHAADGWARGRELIARHGSLLAVLAWAGFFALGYVALPRKPVPALPFLPVHVVAAMAFAVLTVALALAPRSPFNNRAIRALGRVSFSAYLVHFGVIDLLGPAMPGVFALDATGIESIWRSALFLAAVVAVTWLISAVTFRVVEQPMIGLGKALCARLGAARPIFAAGSVRP